MAYVLPSDSFVRGAAKVGRVGVPNWRNVRTTVGDHVWTTVHVCL